MRHDATVFRWVHPSRRDVLRLKPLMDLHYGSSECDLKVFKDYIDDRNENTYFFGVGDLFDMILYNDKRYRRSGDGRVSRVDAVIDRDVRDVYEILKPIKDRIICLGTGNHEDTIAERCGTDPSARLAEKLGVPYCGYSYWIRLTMQRGHSSERGKTSGSRVIDIYCHHGFGGGCRTEGGSVTKYSKAADRFNANICVFGHDHRKQCVTYPVFYLTEAVTPTLAAYTRVVVLGGSFKKTFSDTTNPTWEEKKGFPAVALGGVELQLTQTETGYTIRCLT